MQISFTHSIDCKPYDLIKNIHADLWDSIQAEKSNPTAKDICTFLLKEYSSKDSNSQTVALSACRNAQVPVNMDDALALHGRNKRALIAAFGETIKSNDLADLLFAQR